MSQFFSSGGQRIGASASTSFLLVKSWDGGLIEQDFRPLVTGEVGKVFSSTPAALKCPCKHMPDTWIRLWRWQPRVLNCELMSVGQEVTKASFTGQDPGLGGACASL